MSGTPNGRDHPLAPPRYRVELRQEGRATRIVGFAETLGGCWAWLAAESARLVAAGEAGRLVVVDQETEADVAERDVP